MFATQSLQAATGKGISFVNHPSRIVSVVSVFSPLCHSRIGFLILHQSLCLRSVCASAFGGIMRELE